MSVSVFVIRGNVPSKKNSRMTFQRHGKIINIPSNKYAAWHVEASRFLKKQYEYDEPISRVKLVVLEFFFETNRRADLTNKAESIMDLLVDNGILKDDSWQEIPTINLYSRGVDKENPGCNIKVVHE